MTRLRRHAIGIGAAVVALVVARWVSGATFGGGFPVDDAWIHMVYGFALRTEGSLAYNAGVPATGCTSPLWAIVVALAHLGSREPSMQAVFVVKLIGLALQAVAAFLAAGLGEKLAPPRLRRLAACACGLLVACAPVGAVSAVSGMEVSLETALLLATFAALASRRRWLASLLGGLAVVTRPEAVVVLPIVFLFTRRIGPALSSIAPVVILLVRTKLASGRLLPATFYQKARPPHLARLDIELGFVRDMLGILEPYGRLVMVALVLGVGIAFLLRRRYETAVALAMVGTAIAWVTGLAITIGAPDPLAFYWQRYYAPVLPLLAVGGLVGTSWLVQSLRARTRIRTALFVLLVLLAFGPEVTSLDEARERLAIAVRAIDEVQVKLGHDIADLEEGVVWSQDAGAPRYFGRKRVVDLCRLNTPELLVTADSAPRPKWIVLPAALYRVDGDVEEIEAAQPALYRERVSRQSLFRCKSGGKVTVSTRGVRLASAPCE